MRIGLGCMRLEEDAVVAAAIARGVVWLDTARAYEGSEERIARVLSSLAPPDRERVRVVTKVGMSRPGGAWVADGRARTILEQARASVGALGRPPEVLMLHAPDPRVPLATSVRALVRAKEEGLARSIGLSNPSRRDLDELPSDAPIRAIEVALGPKHDAAARAGMIAWCRARDATLFAHSPLGGVAHAPRLARDQVLAAVAARRGATAAQVMLAYLLALDDRVVVLPGARRVETAAGAAFAGELTLTEEDLAALDERFPKLGRRPPAPPVEPVAEVAIVMGIAGAGKSTLAERWDGWERLNRDTLGGSLAGIAKRLEARLAAGATRVVLDNTYLTRSARSEVVRVAHRAGASVRCVHLDVSLADARINVATRMLERHGALLGGRELAARAREDPGLLLPAPLARMERQLERPAEDEGFTSIETIAFARTHAGATGGVVIGLDDDVTRAPAEGPLLVLGWRPGADEAWCASTLERIRSAVPGREVELGVCTHADGPPSCWCRPPLPGLWLAFARRRGLDPRASTFVVSTASHRTMATELGLRVV
ncbi:MAG: aldo/keto reductase [Labilithrix sp.]|nr:aldo/keto reductase [Labilithrix sp.]MCW5814513.1 aldo/keto reductase [Labilithrix sp.]